MTFSETGCLRFVWALNAYARRQYMLTQHSLADFNAMRCYLSEDERAGYAIDEEGELTCLFAHYGSGDETVASAVLNGARKLDCFDGVLPALYRRHGFIEYKRAPWVRELAPPTWPFEELGRPEVVYMVRHA